MLTIFWIILAKGAKLFDSFVFYLLIFFTIFFFFTSYFIFKQYRSKQHSLEEANKQINLLSGMLKSQIDNEVSKRLETENVFLALFDNSHEGILMLSVTGRFVMCNKTGASILGYSTEELVGRALFEISPVIQPHLHKTSFDAIEDVFEGVLLNEKHRFEWCCISKDGKEVMLEVVLFLLNRTGSQELFMMWRDITELKILQKEKEISQALIIQQTKLAELGSMIGVISHQWKQPINTISLLTQSLEDDFRDDDLDEENLMQFVHSVQRQIDFMTQTMDDFRDFYKPSKATTIFNVFKVTQSVTHLLEGQFLKDKITISFDCDKDVCTQGYASEFKQVILNILNNARDAFEQNSIKKRVIAIKIKELENSVTIQICDNANGIPENIISTIFDPFVSTKGNKGTGIGLSLSKTIIEKMNGNISVENNADGAKFTITLVKAAQ